ncbi:Spermidine/putrescine-binding periplasmic protein 1 [Planktothrix tepida]|uniref:Periplasmic polyamine-binding protein of ABC transporter n=2 Tax=Planktothrix TaxID=54304 RepID=A0A1J1LQR4_9CYAN|nr:MULTISPECIES: extracellular solute-binding protein [Planktothrix]CAD5947367.1 Spermidine/putrescine-binding periplasmic protein 1 [Planktothrix pseudagardhii]CAD5963267.1 Spermidine/putrescine-binding periplasmic protein 1 [Planktothrix tepida]CUR34875.1 Periplasmic polyamine-binding protein of ABC transporter [Planktothrix tepida PCC 9214]
MSTLTLSSVVAGCKEATALRVEVLKRSVPVQMVSKFRQQSGQKGVDFVPQPQLNDLFRVLQKSKSSSSTQSSPQADLVMIGDFWLNSAIQQQLIQPLDPKLWSQWSQLPPRWQNIVRRNSAGKFDSKGEIWAAPYRSGSTVIIYRVDKFKSLGWTPQDWSDLWRQELRHRISLPNQAREVIGLTLKKLGYSYNTADLSKVKNLESELRQLHQNVRLYDSNSYLKPLILGDTWLAVGWSTDISPEVQYQNGLAAVVPKSGTALWLDLWVKPAKVQASPPATLGDQWIDFCWSPQVAAQLSLLTGTTSPIILGMNPEELPQSLRENPLLFPQSSILEKSDFLQPLSQNSIKQYQQLWEKIRLGT